MVNTVVDRFNGYPRARGRILAVESRRELILPSVLALTRAGFSCAVVTPGRHVMEAVRWMRWDVLLIGAHGGVETTLPLVRRIHDIKSLPSVLLAWDADAVPIGQTRDLGIVDVLLKPVDPNALVESISHAMAAAAQ